MNQYLQLQKLLTCAVCRSYTVTILFIALAACNKNELAVPGKIPQPSHAFSFIISPGSLYDEESSKALSVRLHIVISEFDAAHSVRRPIWDTLIGGENLYVFARETKLETSVQTDKELLVNYTVVYNDGGVLRSRSGVGLKKEVKMEI